MLTVQTEIVCRAQPNMLALTEQENLTLQQFLCKLVETIQKFKEDNPNLPKYLSYHICPDSSWVSSEHEVGGYALNTLIRLPSDCHTIITKL